MSDDIAAQRDRQITSDVPCRECGYNLRGLAPEATCPECSHPVNLSLQSDELRFSNRAWLKRVARGARWTLVSRAVSMVAVILAYSLAMSMGSVPLYLALASIFVLTVAAFSIAAAWLLTTPEPAMTTVERRPSARTLARWCSPALLVASPFTTHLALSWLATGGLMLNSTTAFVLMRVFGAIAVAADVALLLYVGRLAQRLPRPALTIQAQLVAWGYGLVSLVFPPGSIVLGLWGLVVLGTFESAIGAIAAGGRPKVGRVRTGAGAMAAPVTASRSSTSVTGVDGLLCRCGRELQGVSAAARCPQCGAPVLRAQGDELRFSDAGWLRQVGRGLILAAIGVMVAGPTFGVGLVLVAIGILRATQREPGRQTEILLARGLARWCLGAAPIFVLGYLSLGYLGGSEYVARNAAARNASNLLGCLALVAFAIGAAAGLVGLRRLAMRIPRPSLAWKFKLAWCVLVLACGSVAMCFVATEMAKHDGASGLNGWNGAWLLAFVACLFSVVAFVSVSATLLGMVGAEVLQIAREMGAPALAGRGGTPASPSMTPRRATPRFRRRQVVFDGDQCIAEDAPCIGCGNSLRGLSRDDTCLQCSTPVGQSIAA